MTLVTSVALYGCGDDGTGFEPSSESTALCALAESLTATAGFPDGIPALTEPALVSADAAGHMLDEDRVLGVVVDGEARAYPHNILWSHEIVNDRFGDRWVTVSFCPLTGSGLAIDATVQGRRVDFGVSGLLFANNLVLYDRESEGLFGPQLSVDARCDAFAGATPELLPVQEMSWIRWKELHPHTRVVSDATGYDRNYRRYPYGEYDQIGNDDLLFPMETDRTRPMKERVLGVRVGPTGGVAFPFGELERMGPRAALNRQIASADVTVFYEMAGGGTAVAYNARLEGSRLTFETTDTGWRDTETGTTWDLSGRAVEGPLAPARLEPMAEAYVAFWFAWRHFQPDAEVWSAN